ncbi:MAG: succinylglutamate desuccinylase [Pseudomonadales bacterium]
MTDIDIKHGQQSATPIHFDRPLLGHASFLHTALAGLSIDSRCILDNGVVVESLSEGVLKFTPSLAEDDSGKTALMISAGVHGNETAPIEIMDVLVDDILSGSQQLECSLLLVLANIPAIRTQARFTSENMNRLFGGDKKTECNEQNADSKNESEAARASELMGLSQQFFAQAAGNKVHYDLHTAIRASKHKLFAISPNSSTKRDSGQSLEEHIAILGRMGIQAVLTGTKSHTTFSAFTARECGATSFTLELGQVRPFGENDLSKLSAFDQTLRLLIANKLKDKTDHSNKPTTYTIVQEVLKENATFELSFEDDAANFTAFTQGDVIAKDGQHSVTAEQTGDCIVFPNANVNIGARALVIARPLENLETNTHKESSHE